MKRPYKILRNISIGILAFVVVVLIAGLIASKYARNKFDEALADSGVTISSLSVNLLTRSVTIKNIEWNSIPDSAGLPSQKLSVERLYVGGIDIIKLVRQKEISIGRVNIYDGDISYHKIKKVKPDSAGMKNIPFKALSIGQITLNNINLKVFNDSALEMSGKLDLDLNDVVLAHIEDAKTPAAYSIGSFESKISGFVSNTSESMYKLRVGSIALSSKRKEINVDSVVLLPKYSKYQFSRKVGKQVDRFVLLAPKLSISGFKFEDVMDSSFSASKVEIANVNLHVYRDKRLPFVRDHNLPLPVALIRTLPFAFAVDSIKISNTKITYQEFPEKGFETGQIVFEKLNASIDHLSNRDTYNDHKQALLKVTSRVMGNGVIDAEFSFPYSKEQIYNAQGSITNLSMHRLNPMLESLAFISVESGRLNELDFNFDYNDISSSGKILINYENLKLKGLNREKDPDKNGFKTWVINMFVKKDKDEDVSKERRMGKVEYVRDRKRAIFNIWVKSLFSGIKSSVIDSPSKKELDQSPKERRDSLRKIEKDSLNKEKKERPGKKGSKQKVV